MTSTDSFNPLNLGIASTAITLALVLFVQALWKQHKLHKYFDNFGLKTPKPWPWIGNIINFYKADYRDDLIWTKTYGKVNGFFFASRPQFLVADPGVANRICIKDSNIFRNNISLDHMNDIQKNFVISMKDDEWRRMRNFLTPTFTSGKIKKMFKKLEECCRDVQLDLNDHIDKGKTTIHLKNLFDLYTMDGMTTCCYSMKLKRAGLHTIGEIAARDKLVESTLKVFKIDFFSVLNAFSTLILPHRIIEWLGIKMLPLSYMLPLSECIKSMIKAREKSQTRYDDFLQSLLDAREEVKESESVTDKFTITDEVIISQAFLFITAGLETTSNLLTSCCYALAFHSEVQTRLSDVIKSMGTYDQNSGSYSFDMDALMSCQYLDAVINETLRRLPVARWTNREPSEDYHLINSEYDIVIPKGIGVWIAISSIMNDPDYWSEPEIFNPERFMPENASKLVPGAFIPFGNGPRHCLGKRFAVMEAKLAIAHIVASFELSPAPETKFPGELNGEYFSSRMKNPIINIRKRLQI